MDVNKEVDRLEKAVKRGDEDAAIEIDTKLAVHEHEIKQALSAMPKEHAETMGFYFRDWFMNLFDEFIFIAMIVLAFNVENEMLSILLGGTGALFLIGRFVARRRYVQFLSNDIWRMRNEKMMANQFKMQLVFIQESRREHTEFLEKARENSGGDILSQIFGGKFPTNLEETSNEDERPKDTEPSDKK